MSADVLRRASALMRERAEAAQPATDGNAWIIDGGNRYANANEVYSGPESRDSSDVATATDAATAAHIASWHPAVALAVAAWLDMQAGCVANYGPNADSPWVQPHTQMALAVALAYLGKDES